MEQAPRQHPPVYYHVRTAVRCTLGAAIAFAAIFPEAITTALGL